MTNPKLYTFGEAIEETNRGIRAALLGNGFSIAQAGGDFRYESLLERCGLEADSPIRKVFRILDTVDFEQVMHALEYAAQIELAYGDKKKSEIFRADASVVRDALIHAIREVHPSIQFEIPEAQLDTCSAFLNNFDYIFTLNYDLLLYWVILRSQKSNHSDGFGLGDTINGFRTFSIDANCTIYYLHGALHLFLADNLETQKRVVTNSTIIDDISSTILKTKKLPLFVSEGTQHQKMARIKSIPYLWHGYQRLSELSDSMFVFGHSVSDNDLHIYNAIFESGVKRLVFCVHRPEINWKQLREKLAPYAEVHSNVEITYIDSSTVSVWGNGA